MWSKCRLPFLVSLTSLAFASLTAAADGGYLINTVAGSNEVGDGGAASDAYLGSAEALSVDAAGNVYIADPEDRRVRMVRASDGTITTAAGTGLPGDSASGAPAAESPLNRPYGVALAPSGVLYIADYGASRVLRVMPDGTLEIIAGGGVGELPGSAFSASFLGPRSLTADSAGNLYVSDFADHRIYKISPSGLVDLIAGTGNPGYNGDGPAASVSLSAPAGLAVDSIGRLYVADSGNNRIRRVAGGFVETFLEGEVEGAPLALPTGVALDSHGVLYVADSGNSRVLAVAPGRSPITIWQGQARDVAVDRNDNLYVAGGRQVWRLTDGAQSGLVAGCGVYGNFADGIPAASAYLRGPVDVAVGSSNSLLVVEEQGRLLRKIDSAGIIQTMAGTGEMGSQGDGGPATQAQLVDPVAVTAAPGGQIWISDHLGHRLRRIDPSGGIATVAGNGSAGFAGDGGDPRDILLNRPRGITRDLAGNLYIADSMNHRVRRLRPDGAVSTVAGTGVRGYSGDRRLAGVAQLNTPVDVAVDDEGNLYIADTGNHAIRMVRSDGFIFTIAGDGYRGFLGDGGAATAARLDSPAGLAVDAEGNLYISDTNNHRIRRISPDGLIGTIAGTGLPGFSGDDGSAAQAALRYPVGIAVAASGEIYVADTGNSRVRRLLPLIAPPPVEEPVKTCSVVHAATFQAGPLAPGQITSVFWEGDGLKRPASTVIGEDGYVSRLLSGVEVRFDGVAGPLFYAGSSQINVQAPVEMVPGSSSAVEIFLNGKLHSRGEVSVAESSPGLFTVSGGSGPAVALNQDGTVNSPQNPAPRGSIVVLYGTGEGLSDTPAQTGQPAVVPLPQPVLPVKLTVGGFSLKPLYAGAAPGFAGLMQINVALPDGFFPAGELPVKLTVGDASSQPGVTISVR